MTKQRLISDARRRARSLSVETGRAYQSHLDDVARLTGRDDWKAFIADPAPMPILEASSGIARAHVEVSRTRGRLACLLGAAIAATIPIAAAASLALDADRMSDQSDRVAAETSMLAHVHPPFTGPVGNEDVPARIEVSHSGSRTVTLNLIDRRVTGAAWFRRHLPGRDPGLFIGEDVGGRRMRGALAEGAVMRLVVEVDCVGRTARYVRYEAARDMTSAPFVVKAVTDALRPHTIDGPTAKEVCEAAPTPPIHIG